MFGWHANQNLNVDHTRKVLEFKRSNDGEKYPVAIRNVKSVSKTSKAIYVYPF